MREDILKATEAMNWAKNQNVVQEIMEANEEIWQIKLLIDSEKEVHNQLKENLILMNKDILNKKK